MDCEKALLIYNGMNKVLEGDAEVLKLIKECRPTI